MKKILIIVDAQNDFIDGSLGTPEARNAIPNIVEKIRNFDGYEIIFTQDTHLPYNYLKSKEGKRLPVEHCFKNTNGWAINSEISNAILSKVNTTKITGYEKPTFGCMELVDYVCTISEEVEIEMCGFCTDICVISNALAIKMAAYSNAEITVDASCCAGVTPKKHEAALDAMESCQINIINR